MKKVMFSILVLLLVSPSCKKKKKFVEPEFILQRWAKAVKTLNYNEYKKHEAFPKSQAVFREIYKEYYFTEIAIIKIEDSDDKIIKKDHTGSSYRQRRVIFQCNTVNRKTKKALGYIKGDLLFIKYVNGEKEKRGWLMHNRTLIKVNNKR